MLSLCHKILKNHIIDFDFLIYSILFNHLLNFSPNKSKYSTLSYLNQCFFMLNIPELKILIENIIDEKLLTMRMA